MAIVIQDEQKKNGGWFGFGILFLVLVVIGIAAYYLFFVQPDLIDTTISSSQLKAIDNLKSLNFDSTGVVQEFVKKTKQFVPIPSSPNVQGNSAPFGVQ
ncbi:MAG: hypothetical protein M1320_02035 [Patescibacteria group bacterium]|nr:hypothetical protein [Patescibacteria group bacterium]